MIISSPETNIACSLIFDFEHFQTITNHWHRVLTGMNTDKYFQPDDPLPEDK